MTPHQIQMFSDRLNALDEQMPGYRMVFADLEECVLKNGGEAIVVTPWPCVILPDLMEHGHLQDGPIQKSWGQPSECHNNVMRQWQKKRIHAIGTGFGLSDDGLWREHSWGVRKNGTIVETTVPRVAYYGIKMVGGEAEKWCKYA